MNKKLRSYAGVVSLAILASSAGCGSSDSDAKLTLMSDKLQALATMNAELQRENSALKAQLSDAQATANKALAAAQASQSAVDATNEKVDRMFRSR